MEVKIIRHFTYKLCQRVYINIEHLELKQLKQIVDSIISSDKKDTYLTFAEYYIYSKDKDGYQQTYYKEISMPKNLEKATENLSFIKESLFRLQEESKKETPKIKIEISTF